MTAPYIAKTLTSAQKITFYVTDSTRVITKYEGGKVVDTGKRERVGDPMGPKHLNEANWGARVEAPLPDNLPFTIANEINQPFDFMQVGGKLLQLAQPYKRVNINRGLAERQFWRAIENHELTVDLTFEAYYSSLIDVVNPVKLLMLMAAPVEDSVIAGGSEMVFFDGYWTAPPRITVSFGNFLLLPKVLLKAVNVNWSNKLDDQQLPLSATVSVTMITEDPMGYRAIGEHVAGVYAKNRGEYIGPRRKK
jgi:hypothetical protein